jgi:hypothetical protein
MNRFRAGMRFVGWWFIILGGSIIYQFTMLLLDPETTITHNGAPTSEYSVKLNAVVFISLFVVIGLFAACSPKRWLSKLFAILMGLKSAVGFKK